MNKVILSGNLTKDTELTYTKSNKAICKFTIAVRKRFPTETDTADFLNCIAWDKTAEFVDKYFSKGSGMILSGRIEIQKYTDKDNNTKYFTNINVEEVDFMGKSKIKKILIKSSLKKL